LLKFQRNPLLLQKLLQLLQLLKLKKMVKLKKLSRRSQQIMRHLEMLKLPTKKLMLKRQVLLQVKPLLQLMLQVKLPRRK
jgi:hypothetical protein